LAVGGASGKLRKTLSETHRWHTAVGFLFSGTLPGLKGNFMKNERLKSAAPQWLADFVSPDRWLQPLSAIYEQLGLKPDAARLAAQADLESLAQPAAEVC
jgi:hypothetical protein